MRGWLALVAVCCAPQLARAAESPAGASPQRASGARVFELSTAQRRGGVGVARTWARKTDSQRYRPGYELRGTDVSRWMRGIGVIEGWVSTSVRWGPGHLSASFFENGGMAGIALGPLDLKAGVSTALLGVGVSSGDFDFGLLWPRASLAAALAFGNWQLHALAHVEYSWSWLGPDQYVRGVGLLLSTRRPTAFSKPAAAGR